MLKVFANSKDKCDGEDSECVPSASQYSDLMKHSKLISSKYELFPKDARINGIV